MTKQTVIIEKVPLSESEKMIDRKPNFPKIKTLYLELIENKAKIKPSLVNKDHFPSEDYFDSEKEKIPLKFVDDEKDADIVENFEKKFDNIIENDRKNSKKSKYSYEDNSKELEKNIDSTNSNKESDKDDNKYNFIDDNEDNEDNKDSDKSVGSKIEESFKDI